MATKMFFSSVPKNIPQKYHVEERNVIITKPILASKSPRRKELLKFIIPEFEVIASEYDEKLQRGLTPEEQAIRLADGKAKSVYEKTSGNRVIIGSDTMVVKNGKIFGKPHDEEDAKSMIKELLEGDRTHKVITGLSVIVQKGNQYREFKTFDESKIYLKDISDEEIQWWINTGHAMDKAGAYGIQDEFCVFVEKINGNYASIVGLPIEKLYDIMKEIKQM